MFQPIRRAVLCAGFAVSAFLSGCAGVAPNYAPSIDNVEAMKKIGDPSPMKTGTFDVTPGMQGAKTIGLRGNTMASPVGNHFGDYLASALRQELDLAKLYDPVSGVEIRGTLLTNNIDAGGIRTNAGQIEARFLVALNGKVTFDKVKRIERTWESSFAGAVAIPLAANNYAIMVQALISALVDDPDFVKAVRKSKE